MREGKSRKGEGVNRERDNSGIGKAEISNEK